MELLTGMLPLLNARWQAWLRCLTALQCSTLAFHSLPTARRDAGSVALHDPTDVLVPFLIP